MKPANTFWVTTLVTATLVAGQSWLNATSSELKDRPLAPSKTTVTMDGVSLRGQLVQRDDGVYAVLSASNTVAAAKDVTFHYAAVCTPGLSPMMRMVPRPRLVKGAAITLNLPPLGEVNAEALVEGVPAMPETGTNTVPAQVLKERVVLGNVMTAPPTWSLLVSRGAIAAPNDLRWGATPPVLQATITELGDGHVLIASTPEVSKSPDSPKP